MLLGCLRLDAQSERATCHNLNPTGIEPSSRIAATTTRDAEARRRLAQKTLAATTSNKSTNNVVREVVNVALKDDKNKTVAATTMSRDKESSVFESLAACPFVEAAGDVVEMMPGAMLRFPPMYRKTPRTGPRWKADVHFHAQLKIETESSATSREEEEGEESKKSEDAAGMAEETVKEEPKTKGEKEEKIVVDGTEDTTLEKKENPCSILLTWQAQAREGIAVALTPQPKYTNGRTYEIFFGDRANTNTLIEKRTGGKEKLHVSLPGRHCTETEWTSYWIALHQGKVYAGVGNEPPQQRLGVLEDDPEAALSSTWYVGMGNSSMKRAGERPFYNQYQHVRLTALDLGLATALEALDTTQIPAVINVGDVDAETKAIQAAYEEECRKARARAEKFGIPYKEPHKFLPQNKRQVQSSTGLATGMDLQDPEEKAKQKARRERFGLSEDAVAAADGDDVDTEDIVPVTQAWDNEKLVANHRMDPPKQLWKIVPAEIDTDPFAPVVEEAYIVPEKIHLFAIDWAAFLQIRTNDLSAYFSLYSPTHVEWLGDLGCNIHFADKFSAARALQNLSQEIPTPPLEPEIVPDGDNDKPCSPPVDLGAMGWRLGKTPLRKVSDDRFGRKGTTARILLRLATSQDVLRDKKSSSHKKTRPPLGFSKTRVLGPGSDFPKKKKKNKRNRDKREDAQGVGGGSSGTEEPSLLMGSLKASRSGFSVEEMEAERARKRAKTADEGKSSVDQTNEDAKAGEK